MRFSTLALAASLAALPAAAQYTQGPQPYNSQDPQNYTSPAAQSYSAQDQRYDPRAYDRDDQYDQQQQISQAPPELPAYDQPEAPGDGYIWTPGYWAFGRGGYYWIPGAWVAAPYEGALWTPGYWGFASTGYLWNAGYWGPTVGFYGGINYGFGYFGTGFCGGYWRDRRFFYNREYAHIGYYNRFAYSQRFEGIHDPHPVGRSYSTLPGRGNEFRGGTYNRGGNQFAGNDGRQPRGFQSPAQPIAARPAYPTNGYSNLNRGSYAAPQPYSAPRAPSYNGGSYARPAAPTQNYGGSYSRPSAPQQSFHQSAPSAPHYSAPSGGSSFHSSGGGGGSHSGGGHR